MAEGFDAGGVFYTVDLETGKMLRQAREVEGATGRIEHAFTKVASAVGVLIASLSIERVIRESINASRLFEKALADLSAITGAAGADLKRLRDEAKLLASTSTASAGQVVEAMKLIAGANSELLETQGALAAVTKEAIALSEAAGIELPTAATAVVLALNQFGQGADQASRFVNVLAAGAKFGASEVADTALALKNAGVSAASARVGFEETNAALQTLAAAGVKGAEAGTALRNVILILETSTDKKLKPSVNGLAGALENLRAKGLSATAMADLFGRENIAAGQQLVNSTDKLKTFTAQLTGTQTAYEQAAINTGTFDAALKRMNNTLDLALIKLGDELKPFAAAAADAIARLAQAFIDGAPAIKAAGSALEVVMIALAAVLTGKVVAALTTFSLLLYRAVPAIGAATIATKGFAAAMALLGGPIGIAAGALALLVLNWDNITGAAKTAAEISEGSADRIQAALLKGGSAAAKSLGADLTDAQKTLADLDERIKKGGVRSIYGDRAPVIGQKKLDELKAQRDQVVATIGDIQRAIDSTNGGQGRGKIIPALVRPSEDSGAGNAVDKDAAKKAAEAAKRAAEERTRGYLQEVEGERQFQAEIAAIKDKQIRDDQTRAEKAAEDAASLRVEIAADRKAAADELARSESETFTRQTQAVNPIEYLRQEYEAKLAIVQDYEGRMAAAGVDATEQAQIARTEITRTYEAQRLALAEQSFRSQGEAQAFLLDTLTALQSTATNAVVGLLQGTTDAEAAIRALGQTVLNEAVGALVQYGVQQVKNAVLSNTLAAADKARAAANGAAYAASVGAQVAGMSALAAQNAFAATAAIPIIGPGLAPVAAAAAGAQAAALGAPAVATAPIAGARQYGGPVNVGSMYRVNETGAPEMFVGSGGRQYMMPTTSGQVIPADQVGGMGGGEMRVTVSNYGSAQVETRQIGPREVEIMIDRRFAAEAASIRENSGQIFGALTSSTNVRPRM